MTITYRPIWFSISVAAMLAGLWLVFWAPDSFLPALRYALGSLLLALGSSQAAVQLSVRPRGGVEEKMAPAELGMWLSLACVGAITLYLLLNSSVLARTWSAPEAQQMSIKLLMIVVFWIVVSTVLRARRRNDVLEDERDREIRRMAAGWGHGALVFCILALVVMLGLSPWHRLQWATPPFIVSQLLFALMCGWLCEYAATVVYYWRDRR
ncbi:MAG: hypothetical protein ABIP44_03415 [Pseudoxanthomonas sp.]